MTALALVDSAIPSYDPKRVETLGKALDGMDPDHVACRDFNHSWKDFGAKWYPSLNYYEQILRCLRCGTQKFRYLSKTGHVLDQHYEYAPGYLMPQGMGRLSTEDRDSIRLASIKRVTLREVADDG